MSDEAKGYILTEIWNARPTWLALSEAERHSFIDDHVAPFLRAMLETGAELVACAVNENSGPERLAYAYMAVWNVPDKAFADRLEAGAKALGFTEYFDQANFSGSLIPPQVMNDRMIALPS